MARPLMRACELRTRVDVYLDVAERAEIHRRATQARLPLSAFLRKAALGQRVTTVPSGNVERWASLAQLAGNLSQIARHLNAGRLTGVDAALLEAVAAEVRGLRLDLLGGER